jgi:hypothetical protein
VLTEYNKRLAAEARTSPLKAHLEKCTLYTVLELIKEREDYIDSLGIGILHEPEASEQLLLLQKVRDTNGNKTGGSYFFKVPTLRIQSGAQASFEVPVSRIGQLGTALVKGFEKAFEREPALAQQPPNEANHFAFARTTAHELVTRFLALPSAPAPGSPTLQVASGVTAAGIASIHSIFTISFFNRMIGLGDPKSWRWDARSHDTTDDVGRAPVLSTEKDKYGLLFKTSPDDLVRKALGAEAKALLQRFAAHAGRQALLEEMCRKLVDQNPSSRGKTASVKATWATDIADFTAHHLMPRVRARYPNETAVAYGSTLNRDADDTDLASGKPLPVRSLPSGTIAMVVETRSSNHRFSMLVATNPRTGVTFNSTTALQGLRHFQAA